MKPSLDGREILTASSKCTPDPNEFKGKCVLVTGGTKVAGKAIAEGFRRGGATVIITARSEPEEKRTINLFRKMSQPPKADESN